MLPEVHALVPDDDAAWVTYLACSEVVKALLCAALAAVSPRYATAGSAAAVWFLTQAADEAFNGNLWAEQLWEYPLLAVLALTVYLIERTKR